jgi:hypothetical protein
MLHFNLQKTEKAKPEFGSSIYQKVKQTRPKRINEKFRGKSGSNYKYICSYNFNTARTAVTASTFKATK